MTTTRTEALITVGTKKKPKTPWSMRKLIAHLLIVAAGIAMIYPLLWMVSSSLKPAGEIFTNAGLPMTWTLQNYVDGWNAIGFPFLLFVGNSALVALGSVLGNLLSCTLAAYAFARLEFRFKRTMFAAMMATLMLPFQVILVPQYILFNNLGLVDSFWPLLIPKFLAVDTFFIFLMIQFIRGLPRSLDDAASIDGCGPFGVFWRIILPLMRPALAVTAAFTFIWTWNDFLTPLLYLPSREKFTVPLALNAFLDSEGASQWGPMFAMSCLSLLPVFLLFLFAQRHLVNGIATTGLK
ncbi:MAG: carbohydrate ABC transporter permease [Microbacterium sp.]|jgi:multiple sugar transport system permease protein|uniref:carbohydrate ABC transporter permease n=1 Tax=Microbacterium sp. TaxID=51671 RepID=UPI00282CC4E6|nr:carbohydrate ABC transporter permease [Microbacterium sp.]MDR2321814.1 carbohydrate ABC transporter permease [Microbacterium sp.]